MEKVKIEIGNQIREFDRADLIGMGFSKHDVKQLAGNPPIPMMGIFEADEDNTHGYAPEEGEDYGTEDI